MARFKRRHPSGRHAGFCRYPWKLCGTPPDDRFRVGEKRRLGGRVRRMRRRDVEWAFRDEA
jgi:hypothetical protein